MTIDFKNTPKYCISLLRSTDRRELMLQEFSKRGIRDVIFYDAVDKNDIVVPELSIKENKASIIPQAPGILACMRSHRNLMRHALKMGHDSICVFEDDAILCDDFWERMSYIENIHPRLECDFFALGGHFPDVARIDAEETPHNHIFHIKSLNGTYGYIISRNVMEFCVRNLHYNWGIDQFFGDFLYKRFKALTFLPFLVSVRPCFSEVLGVHCDYHNARAMYVQNELEDYTTPYKPALADDTARLHAAIDAAREARLKSENR